MKGISQILLFLVLCHLLKSELISIAIVSRHGDRNPMHKINYIHENLSYDGELLQKGKDRLEYIGKKIREKYFSILKLSEEYQEDSLLFKSTNSSRTIDSLQSFSKGLFPKLNKQVKIDIEQINNFILMRFTSCPKALEAMIKSKELAKYEKDNEQWITQLQKILKSNDSGWDFFAILDSLVCLKQIGYPLPEGMSEDLYNKAEKGRDDCLNFNFVLHFIDNQWCDVASGFFFNELLFNYIPSDINNYNNNQSYQKLRYFSAHDTTLLSILGCIGAPFEGISYQKENQRQNENKEKEIIKSPQFGAVLIIEIHQDDNQQIYLQFLYNAQPEINEDIFLNIKQIIPKYCNNEEKCTLEKHQQHWQNAHNEMIDQDWLNKACGIKENQQEIDINSKEKEQNQENGKLKVEQKDLKIDQQIKNQKNINKADKSRDLQQENEKIRKDDIEKKLEQEELTKIQNILMSQFKNRDFSSKDSSILLGKTIIVAGVMLAAFGLATSIYQKVKEIKNKEKMIQKDLKLENVKIKDKQKDKIIQKNRDNEKQNNKSIKNE